MYKVTITYLDKHKIEFEAKDYEMMDNYLQIDMNKKVVYFIPFNNVLEFRIEEI